VNRRRRENQISVQKKETTKSPPTSGVRQICKVQTANLAGGTFLAEANVELVVEQGLVVGANIDRDRQALQHM
jgi:hypothetical protein